MLGFIVRHTHQGIGKIEGVNDNILDVCFLETGESAQFASTAILENELRRHRLPNGTQCDFDLKRCTVRQFVEQADSDDPYRYSVSVEPDGLIQEVSEVDLRPLERAAFQGPLEKLRCRDPGSYSLFAPRERLLKAIQSQLRNGNGLRAMLSSRIDLRPHQAYVAGVVLLDESRRYLLADEVGLGKTIEAGIVITDLLISKPDAKILILCPGALTQQWLCEIYSKFTGTLFRMLEMIEKPKSEWQDVYKLIASFEQGGLQDSNLLLQKDWDLVVIDEVHHLLASEPLYHIAQELSRQAKSLLLLSALPAKRREDEFLRLLALLEPDRYTDDVVNDQESFKKLYENQQIIGRKLRLTRRRLEGIENGDFTRDDAISKIRDLSQLEILESDQRLSELITQLQHDDADEVFIEHAENILHYVGSNYRINRRILRNRRQRLLEKQQIMPIHRSLQREAYDSEQLEYDLNNAVHAMLIDMTSRQQDTELSLLLAGIIWQSTVHPNSVIDLLELIQQSDPVKVNEKGKSFLSIGSLGSSKNWQSYIELLCSSNRSSVSESLLEQTLNAARLWRQSESSYSRLKTLVNVLGEQKRLRHKVLVFVGYPTVAELIADALNEEFGAESTVVFLSDDDREIKEANVRAFQAENDTWVLVSDESGGEGRNFQFADCVVHYDTPWNVSRIEQRIGRLDRLGRDNPDVKSIVLYDQSSVEAGLIECYEHGLGVYHASISGLEFSLRDVEAKLLRVALQHGLDGLMDSVGDIKETVDAERGRDESDALLDEASFDRILAEGFLRVKSTEALETELEKAFIDYFELIANGTRPVHDQQFPEGIWRFRGDQIHQVRNELTSRLEAVEGSFRRRIVQQRPSLQFFGVGNRLFDAIYHSLFSEVVGRTYAIEIQDSSDIRWLGFEYVFYPSPQIDLLHDNPGLINRARQCFAFSPIHVFCDHAGKIEPAASSVERIRMQQTRHGHNQAWWNFTRENAEKLAGVFTSISWEDRIASSHDKCRAHALSACKASVDETLAVSLQRLKLQIKGVEASDGDVNYAQPLQDLEQAIKNWSLELDSVGFLAINAGLREKVHHG